MKVPTLLQDKRFFSLDGLRAISIALVVIGHVNYNDGSFISSLGLGDYGVRIFFVISGFLITTLLLKERISTQTISLKNFYIRRFLRIFPVAYLFLLVLFILNRAFDLQIPSNEFLSSALYVSNTDLLGGVSWYTGHFWSLATEEQFYLIFPLLLLVLPIRSYVWVLIGLTILGPALNYAVVHNVVVSRPIVVLNSMLRHMPPILIGSLTSVLMFSYGSSFVERIRYRGLISLFLFVLAGAIQFNFVSFIPSSSYSIIVSIMIVAFIVLNLVDDTNLIFKFLNYKPVVYIGVLSYSIYIWQQLFTHMSPWQNVFGWSDSILLNLGLLMVVSYVSYNFYEKKFLEIKDRFSDRAKKNISEVRSVTSHTPR